MTINLTEREERKEALRDIIRRCVEARESGTADHWWIEDQQRAEHELRMIEDEERPKARRSPSQPREAGEGEALDKVAAIVEQAMLNVHEHHQPGPYPEFGEAAAEYAEAILAALSQSSDADHG